MRRRRSGLNFGRQKKKVNMSVVKEVCVWIIEIAITLLVAFTLVYFVGLRTSVVGQSMAETLNGGDEILVNRFIYKVTDPRPNDVIVFLPNGNEKSHYYIKRVIAVPEDTLQIRRRSVCQRLELFAEDVDVAQMEMPDWRRKRSRAGRNALPSSITVLARTNDTSIKVSEGSASSYGSVTQFPDFGFYKQLFKRMKLVIQDLRTSGTVLPGKLAFSVRKISLNPVYRSAQESMNAVIPSSNRKKKTENRA
ncbi:MAG: signal peptidase I [Roseburia hominis]